MNIQINPDGSMTFPNSKLFRAGVMQAYAHEIGETGCDEYATFNVYYSPQVVGDESFLRSVERAPLIVGHRCIIEDRHIEGRVDSVTFDGEWARGDVVIKTIAAIAETAILKVIGLSLGNNSGFEPMEATVLDGGVEIPFSHYATDLIATHLAIVPLGRVRDAKLARFA